MARTDQIRRIATRTLTIVTIAVILQPSTLASGAPHTSRVKHSTKGKHSCTSQSARHVAHHATHRRSAHVSRTRPRHGKVVRCIHKRPTKRKTSVHVGVSSKGGASSLATGTITGTGVGAGPQTSWTPAGTAPLSDAQAAALVTREPEQRPENEAANDYVPTAEQLAKFHAQADPETPLNKYVDGLDGMTKPSTDDLIQWGAHKWGIPEDWLKAEYVMESDWRQSKLGDEAEVSPEWYAEYPAAARIAPFRVYQSMGITQLKWNPGTQQYPGTEPLRWESTAFNIDFQAAMVRYFFDGYCDWCGSGYGAGQQWNSIGAWYSPKPWANAGAESYIDGVQKILSEEPWLSKSF